MKIDLVITKNISFFTYLIKEGIVPFDVELKEYVTPIDVVGKHVIGELCHSLSCVALSYTEVPLHLPKELVGQRLVIADYEKYASSPITYCINRYREKG